MVTPKAEVPSKTVAQGFITDRQVIGEDLPNIEAILISPAPANEEEAAALMKQHWELETNLQAKLESGEFIAVQRDGAIFIEPPKHAKS